MIDIYSALKNGKMTEDQLLREIAAAKVRIAKEEAEAAEKARKAQERKNEIDAAREELVDAYIEYLFVLFPEEMADADLDLIIEGLEDSFKIFELAASLE